MKTYNEEEMSEGGTYSWRIEETRNGKYLLSAHGFLVEIFGTKAEAEERIAHTTKRDEVERRAKRRAEHELNQWADEWATEFDLPRSEVLEDIRAGVTSLLSDLEQ